MSSKNKIRGRNVENQIVVKHVNGGIPAERVPLSGSLGGKYNADIAIPNVSNREFSGECKSRKGGVGFSLIERWLGDNDFLYLKRNYGEPLVVMNFDLYLKLLGNYYETKTNKPNNL